MKRLAWVAALAGAATLFHCGGTSDVVVAGDDGGADGTAAEGGGGADGGGKDATGGGHDGSSGGADSSSGAGEGGGGHEGGAEGGGHDGGHDGGLEGGGGDGGAGDSGGGDGGGDAAQDGGGGNDGGGSDAGGDGGGDAGGNDSGGDSGGDSGPTDAGSDSGPTDAGDGGITSQALFRVGAVMPLPSPIDFCWAQAGGAWNGPVMLGWGVSTRLPYQQVSDYVSVPLAATTVRIVNGTSTGCNTALGEATFTPTAANDAFFVAEFEQGNVAPVVKAFLDERTTTSATNTKLRAIHAAITQFTGAGPIGQPIDLYVGVGTTASLFDNVSFASTAAAGNGVDANGYLSRDTFNNADVRVRLHGNGGADLLDAPAFSTTAGHVYSLFTVGVHNLSVGNTSPMRLLVCDDTAPVAAHLFACKAVGTQL